MDLQDKKALFSFQRAAEILEEGLADQAYPGAALAIGDRDGELFRYVTGNRAVYPQPLPLMENTRFDIASLTKVMNTMIGLKLMEEGRLSLNSTLAEFFDCPSDKRPITIKHLLTHTSGIDNFKLCDKAPSPDAVVETILREPLSAPVGARASYSCMGLILFGKICEQITGKPLDQLLREYVCLPLGMADTGYVRMSLPAEQRGDNFASTEYCEELGRYLCGESFDEKTRLLDGVAANAGVFSTVGDISRFARMMACKGRIPGGRYLSGVTFEMAARNYTAHLGGEYRGIGFAMTDTELNEGQRAVLSCGDLFTDGSYGHTGFTGTCMWADVKTGLYVVLLTNRIHFGNENQKLLPLQRRLHNFIVAEYDRKMNP